jgi:LysR family glycine cleavage system transcriptional activator
VPSTSLHQPRNRRLPPLSALRAFEVAARRLSFSRAATELGVTQGAISRQIKVLEEYLRISLFRRRGRTLELTAEGQQYLTGVHNAFEELYRATEDVLDGRHDVTLTTNVLPTFAMRWLVPRLPRFSSDNPSIDLRMITSMRPVDFRLQHNEIAIRVSSSMPWQRESADGPIDLVVTHDWTNVRALPLMADELVVVCAPALCNDRRIRTPRDLNQHDLLFTTARGRAWSYWSQMVGCGEIIGKRRYGNGHFFMTIQAALEGKGVAIIPRILIETELASGMLVMPLADASVTAGAYYLLCREHAWDIPKVKRFRDWLLSEIEPSARPEIGGSSTPPIRAR